jgi:4'-phosphopantetheinyl transferase
MDVRWSAVTGAVAPYAFTPSELRRADAFRFAADRDAYLAAHALVRDCAGAVLGADPAGLVLTHLCPGCGGTEHGRPIIEGVHVSLSHTRTHVAAAAAGHPIGVDIEEAGRGEIPDTVLAPGERGDAESRLRRWVLKEALIKVGATSLDELAGVDLSQVDADGRFRWRDWALEVSLVDGGRARLGVATP